MDFNAARAFNEVGLAGIAGCNRRGWCVFLDGLLLPEDGAFPLNTYTHPSREKWNKNVTKNNAVAFQNSLHFAGVFESGNQRNSTILNLPANMISYNVLRRHELQIFYHLHHNVIGGRFY